MYAFNSISTIIQEEQKETFPVSCIIKTKSRDFKENFSLEKIVYTRFSLNRAILHSIQKNYPEITSILIGFVPSAFQVFEKYPDIKHPKGEMINSETSRYKLSNETKISNDDIAMFLRFGAFVYIQSIYGILVDSQNVVQKSWFLIPKATILNKYNVFNK